MSSRYWRVSPKFWPDTEDWSDDARMLALYLLTCEHRTTEGLFRLPVKYVAADLGWAADRVHDGFGELLDEGFMEHDPDRSLVLVVNAMKYQAPENPNQVTHALRKLESIPLDSPLTRTFKGLAERFCQPLAERLPEGFGKPLALAPPPSPSRPLLSSDESNDREEQPDAHIHRQFIAEARRAAQ